MNLAATWWALPLSRKVEGKNDTFEFLAIWEYFDILSLKSWFNNASEVSLHFLFVYLCYYEFTQESPEKEKKGVETPDLIIQLDHKCLLMYSYWNSII